MGSLQRYPDYSDSGISWVGEIPSHWQVKPTFAVADEESIKNSDGKETTVLSLSYGKVIVKDVEKNFGLLPESFDTYQLVFNGDIILRLTDLQNDKRSLRVGLSKHQGIITSAYLKLVCKRKELLPSFAYRLLHSYDTTKVFYGMGGGLRQSMKFSDFRRLPLLVPPVAEQTQIAVFLDRETAKIDRLIEKQQRLIKLLEEKRQAVISHAVTKGLNPNTPMKNSGIEWLGEVPAYWTISKVKFTATINPSKSQVRGLDENTEVTFLPMEAIGESGELDLSQSRALGEVINGYTYVGEGDVIIAKITPCFENGKGAVAKRLQNGAAFATTEVVPIRPSRRINADFLYYVLSTRPFRKVAEGSMYGAGGQKRVADTFIANYTFVLPPIETQIDIVESIENMINRFDSLKDKAREAISLMAERRTALISAAVTGKIDVRNQVPQDVEEAVAS